MAIGSRIVTFDLAKALVMLQVVGGHIYGSGIVANANEWIEPYYSNFTVGVDMPLFFMISGYFSDKSIRDGSWGKIIARTIGLLWPVAAFGVIFGIANWQFGAVPLWKVLLYPFARIAFADWFLLTLGIIYFSTAFLMKMGRNKAQRLSFLALFYIGLFFAPRGIPFHWTRNVMHMFPYFVFGMFILRPYELHRKVQFAIPAALLFVATVFWEGDATMNGMSFYTAETQWRAVVSDKHLFMCFWARTLVGIAGSIVVLWALNVLCSYKYKYIEILAGLGMTTLGVYLIHQLLLMLIKQLEWLPLPLVGCWKWPLAVVVLFVSHLITLQLRKSHIFRFIFFGDEKWLSKCIDRSA